MTAPGLIILIALLFVMALIYMELGGMPGKTARARGHPQADAISTLGWIGLLLGVAPWLVAMVWARMRPLTPPSAQESATPESTGKQDDTETS